LGKLDVPKIRGDGEYKAIFYVFAWNPATGFAEGFVEFEEKVWSNRLEEHLSQQGAACIDFVTFQHNDNNESAGAALARVWMAANKPGFEQIAQGDCNPRLLAKAKELEEKYKKEAQGRDIHFDEKTQEAMRLSLQEIKDKMVTKEELAKTIQASSQDTIKVLDRITDVQNTVVQEQSAIDRLMDKADHSEHISYQARGKLGAEASKQVKRTRKDMGVIQRENEKLKRQLLDKDRMMEERLKGLEAKNADVQAKMDANQEELKATRAELKAARAELKASQAEGQARTEAHCAKLMEKLNEILAKK
jgi:DNA repair exonuclease SbcCD ATPase subunit